MSLIHTGGVFPVELDLFEFTAEEHVLRVTATDAAGQPSVYNYTFFGIPDLMLICNYADNVLLCEGNNRVTSYLCTFDGRRASSCSFPLEIRLTGLRLGEHTVTIVATDEFDQTDSSFLTFEFILGPINVMVPSTASVIERTESSPVFFSISGQALSTVPFSLTPLTYNQFETRTGLMVSDLFDNVPQPADLSKYNSLV